MASSPTTTPSTLKTRLLLMSDTHFLHTHQPNLSDTAHPFSHPIPPADILIHAGDLTSTGLYHEHALAISLIRSHPAELKLVVPGNHDVTLDTSFYLKEKPHMSGDEYPEDVERIRELYTSGEARRDGVRYLEEGTGVFALKSGVRFSVYASAYTPEFCAWGFAYEREADRFNASVAGDVPVPSFPNVDIIVTHGPPKGVLDLVAAGAEEVMSVGCEHLWRAVKRSKPRLHVFGHIHEDWGAEKWDWDGEEGKKVVQWTGAVPVEEKRKWVKEKSRYLDVSSAAEGKKVVYGESTMFVNASIMNVYYEAVNAPWIIDLDLPLA